MSAWITPNLRCQGQGGPTSVRWESQVRESFELAMKKTYGRTLVTSTGMEFQMVQVATAKLWELKKCAHTGDVHLCLDMLIMFFSYLYNTLFRTVDYFFCVMLLLWTFCFSSTFNCMALNGLYCAEMPLRNYSLTHSFLSFTACYAWPNNRCKTLRKLVEMAASTGWVPFFMANQ